jgi:hypothetical protein
MKKLFGILMWALIFTFVIAAFAQCESKSSGRWRNHMLVVDHKDTMRYFGITANYFLENGQNGLITFTQKSKTYPALDSLWNYVHNDGEPDLKGINILWLMEFKDSVDYNSFVKTLN